MITIFSFFFVGFLSGHPCQEYISFFICCIFNSCSGLDVLAHCTGLDLK